MWLHRLRQVCLTRALLNVEQERLSWGRCVLCRMLLSAPAFHLLDANSTTPPGVTTKRSPDIAKCGLGAKSPCFRAPGIRSGSAHFTDKISYLWEDRNGGFTFMTHSFIHLFHTYLLSTYYVPDTVLDTRDARGWRRGQKSLPMWI